MSMRIDMAKVAAAIEATLPESRHVAIALSYGWEFSSSNMVAALISAWARQRCAEMKPLPLKADVEGFLAQFKDTTKPVAPAPAPVPAPVQAAP